MNTNFTYKILAVLIFLCTGYNGHVGAAEEVRSYFHFGIKPDREYPFEMYVRYKPVQLINNKGIELNLVYENKENKTYALVLDENYCDITIFNNGAMVQPRRAPKGLFKIMTEAIYPRDGDIIEKGKSRTVKINIDKIIDTAKKATPTNRKDVLIDITPSKYGIKLICMGFLFSGRESKTRANSFAVETDIFHITYNKSE